MSIPTNEEENKIVVGRSIDDLLDDLVEESSGSDDTVAVDIDFSKNQNDPSVVLSPSATPLEVIKFFVESSGISIKNKPDANCRKCYGRGFTAFDATSHMPIPCKCLFHKEDTNSRLNKMVSSTLQQSTWNRAQRRMAKR